MTNTSPTRHLSDRQPFRHLDAECRRLPTHQRGQFPARYAARIACMIAGMRDQRGAAVARVDDGDPEMEAGEINGRRQAGWACAHHQAIQGRRHSAIARTNVAPTAGRGAEPRPPRLRAPTEPPRSEEHTPELQSLMRISYAAFCLKKKTLHVTTTIKQ